MRNKDTDNDVDDDDDDDVNKAIVSSESDPIVNHVSFRYRINNERLCDLDVSSRTPAGRSHIFLFVYIHTAPENYMKRLLLRQTWVQTSLYNLPVRFAFFLGSRSADAIMDQAVQLEADHFHDIIQAEFEDSYKNLTLKSLHAMQWITRHCSRSRFILKTDDDAFVNMRALLQHLSDIYNSPSRPRRLVLCRIWSNMHVLRDDQRWSVSREEYQPDFYPPYCSGIAWVMTPDMIRALVRISSRVKSFWIDDVYITGLLTDRYKLSISLKLKLFYNRWQFLCREIYHYRPWLTIFYFKIFLAISDFNSTIIGMPDTGSNCYRCWKYCLRSAICSLPVLKTTYWF